jgi:hypothetical protein
VTEEDDMFDIPRLYISSCSYAVQPTRLYPILMSILFHHYRQLTECIEQVEQMMVKVEGLQKVEDSPTQSKLFDF